MILHENRLPTDDSHEISCLFCYFCKSGKFFNCCLLQIIGDALWVESIFLLNSLKCFVMKKKDFFSISTQILESVFVSGHTLKRLGLQL